MTTQQLSPEINTLRTYLESNTDKQGEPLYERAKIKLNELVSKEFEGSFQQPPRLQAAQERSVKEVVDFGTFAMGTPAGMFIEGVADLPLGAAQFISESLGFDQVTNFLKERENRIAVGRDAVESSQGRETPVAESDDFSGSRLVGNIAGSIPAASGVPVAATRLGKVAQGAGLGAVFGAAAPATSDDFDAQKTGQIAAGATIGALVPAAIGAVRKGAETTRNIVDPLLPKGLDRSVERMVEQTTDDVDELIVALRNAGSGQTVGQAQVSTGNTRLSAMAKKLENRASDAFARISGRQNAERISQIRIASGGRPNVRLTETIDDLTNARKIATDPLYAQASQSTARINARPVVEVIDRLIKKDPNNSELVPVLNELKRQLVKRPPPPQTGRIPIGGRPTQRASLANTARELISTSRDIGTRIGKKDPVSGKSVNENIVRQLTSVKRALDEAIGDQVTAFREANEEFARRSVPIDRAAIGLRLENKLTSALSGDESSVIQQRASGFASALDDERGLVSQATGFKRNKGLQSIFGDDGVERLQAVADELKSNAELQRLAVLGGKGADRITSELEGHTLVNPLNRVLMVVNGIIKRGGTVRKEAALNDAAEIFQDPARLAELLERANPRELTVLRRLISALPLRELSRTAPAIAGTRE